MKFVTQRAWLTSMLAVPLLLIACDGSSPNYDDQREDGGEHADRQQPENLNLIDIPAPVRNNLGITFVQVERRRVEQTLRVPGHFEYQPSARRDYRTPVPGRVELEVEQFQKVEAGAVLYRIDSPGWRELQQNLAEAGSEIDQLRAQIETYGPLLEAHQEHEQSLRDVIEVWTTRVEGLEGLREAGGGRIEQLTQARAELSSARADLAQVQEKKAELTAERQQAQVGIRAAESRLNYLLDDAAAVTALGRADLLASTRSDGRALPRWSTIDRIEVRSEVAGVVAMFGLTTGAWADEKTSVVTVVQPDRLRFRASGLQSDLGVLRDGLSARIVSPSPTASGRSISISDDMTGELQLGLEGDPNERTVEMFVIPEQLKDWARPGVSAQLEVVFDESAITELTIPLAAVQRDGLTPVIFRRQPDDPNQVMRMEADLGRDDGRWVELLSGVAEGDEIVLDGGFQLMLSSSGSIQKGGHFHADGTFHEGEH
ncbi:efflux RND transporter periplasmic adaptor subunit [Algisphaera agarilytica]|uniref:Multidrug resistance efflux pump n=1 Tax=Algisphaera agarilytica TaxID=1385975 RepID=A0A7X0H6S2_9BACT|nr:HlyD family efflux transporter periplasmic adaptor subunit [Algisphaera agarilytica]MBB6428844.1 multidrug resistance efflux pump [Algisphaera agarilytica]